MDTHTNVLSTALLGYGVDFDHEFSHPSDFSPRDHVLSIYNPICSIFAACLFGL